MATGSDAEIELIETTYRLNPDGTGDVAHHQRFRALTAQGRQALSQLHVPYVASFQDVDIRFVRTIQEGRHDCERGCVCRL